MPLADRLPVLANQFVKPLMANNAYNMNAAAHLSPNGGPINYVATPASRLCNNIKKRSELNIIFATNPAAGSGAELIFI